MGFVSGVSSTYDYSVYAQRQALLAEARQKTTSFSSASTDATSAESASKTEKDKKSDSTSTEKTTFKFNSPIKELPEEVQKEVEKLKARDLEVKQHEQAHQRVGAGITGQAEYSYKAGPDGKQYAVGGSVSIDMSEETTPEATISKAGLIRRTALAPKDPSSQDLKVAQEASQMETEARAELLAKAQEASKSYASVKNIATSKSAPQMTATEGTDTGTNSAASSTGVTSSPTASATATPISQAAGKMVNPYVELSAKMSDNSAEPIEIKASNTKKLDLLSGKTVDLFG